MSRDPDERNLLEIVDHGAEEDAAWDEYRYSENYDIDRAAKALKMPEGDAMIPAEFNQFLDSIKENVCR